ncbi:MAG: VOC family protein [Candidatus Muirbacterium halophilum]|nr:VOC family protein [Candidatus Muirbacterium halophilum]MCK9476650.1 VOC family protein [Candidatus Muirbacterium halophilum]
MSADLKVNIRYIYNMCNDIDEISKFYTHTIGLKEKAKRNDEKWGWVVYASEGFEFIFFRAKKTMPVISEFAWQPGGGGGHTEMSSWTISLPKNQFIETLEKLKANKYYTRQAKPIWLQDFYWGIVAKDPMGNTVELTYEPEEYPESTVWK